MLDILLEDGPVLAVNKPGGLLTLGAKPGIPTLEREVKAWLKERFQKPGNVYLGIPHRLDRPVSGVILFARNSKAAARLAEQFRDRQVQKTYWGIVEKAPAEPEGTLSDWLAKVPETAATSVVEPDAAGAREAILHYRTLAPLETGALLEIQLETGRMHQIRAQFGSRGWPLWGDVQYGGTQRLVETDGDPAHGPIALHARRLQFLHPVRYDAVEVTAPLPATWDRFGLSLD